MWGNVFERSPVPEEGLRRPAASGLDNVRGGAGYEKLSGASNAETVSGSVWVSEGLPNGVTTLKESCFSENSKCVCGIVGKKKVMSGNSTDANMVLEYRDRIDGVVLINENNIFTLRVCLGMG